jgi:hypothetical protein
MTDDKAVHQGSETAQQCAHAYRSSAIVRNRPKSEAGERTVPVPPALNALREWKLACPKGSLDLVLPNLSAINYLSNRMATSSPAASSRCGSRSTAKPSTLAPLPATFFRLRPRWDMRESRSATLSPWASTRIQRRHRLSCCRFIVSSDNDAKPDRNPPPAVRRPPSGRRCLTGNWGSSPCRPPRRRAPAARRAKRVPPYPRG